MVDVMVAGILWPSSSLSNGWMVGETMRRLAKDLGDQGCFSASMLWHNMTIQKPGIFGGDSISHQSYMFYYVVLFFETIYLKHRKFYCFWPTLTKGHWLELVSKADRG